MNNELEIIFKEGDMDKFETVSQNLATRTKKITQNLSQDRWPMGCDPFINYT
jgi:hypothetical protein